MPRRTRSGGASVASADVEAGTSCSLPRQIAGRPWPVGVLRSTRSPSAFDWWVLDAVIWCSVCAGPLRVFDGVGAGFCVRVVWWGSMVPHGSPDVARFWHPEAPRYGDGSRRPRTGCGRANRQHDPSTSHRLVLDEGQGTSTRRVPSSSPNRRPQNGPEIMYVRPSGQLTPPSTISSNVLGVGARCELTMRCLPDGSKAAPVTSERSWPTNRRNGSA